MMLVMSLSEKGVKAEKIGGVVVGGKCAGVIEGAERRLK